MEVVITDKPGHSSFKFVCMGNTPRFCGSSCLHFESNTTTVFWQIKILN